MSGKVNLIKKVVFDISAGQREQLLIAIVILCFITPLAMYSNTNLYITGYDEDLIKGNAIINFIALLALGFFITAIIKYYRFNISFNQATFPIAWQYDNGNVFILNNKGILNHIQEPPQAIVSTTFKGITWELEDLKGIVEDIGKGEMSFATFLPSLEFENQSNVIESYIPFKNADKLNVVFYDLELIQILVINLIQKADKAKLTLSIPIPTNIKFGEKELMKLVENDLVSIKCEALFHYVNQSQMESM